MITVLDKKTKILIIAYLAFLIFISLFSYFTVKREIRAKNKEIAELVKGKENIYHHYEGIFSEIISKSFEDLVFLCEIYKAGKENIILQFLKHHSAIDQFRVIDLEGYEVARFQRSRSSDEIEKVPASALQFKGNRYYIQGMKKLAPEEIYVSQIDLNIEHGRIEYPHRWMIRIGYKKDIFYLININLTDLIEKASQKGLYFISKDLKFSSEPDIITKLDKETFDKLIERYDLERDILIKKIMYD